VRPVVEPNLSNSTEDFQRKDCGIQVDIENFITTNGQIKKNRLSYIPATQLRHMLKPVVSEYVPAPQDVQDEDPE
jgi:hypothetical protein